MKNTRGADDPMKKESWRGVQGYEDLGRNKRGLEESERGEQTRNITSREEPPDPCQDKTPTVRPNPDQRTTPEIRKREDTEKARQRNPEKGRPPAPQPGPGRNKKPQTKGGPYAMRTRSKDPSPQRPKTPDQSELESSDEEITNPMLFDLPSPNNTSNPRPNQSGSRSPQPNFMAPLLTDVGRGVKPIQHGATGTWPLSPPACHCLQRGQRPGSGSSRQRHLEMSWP
ncbi:unnamed protein product [Arctogadus glacialis]